MKYSVHVTLRMILKLFQTFVPSANTLIFTLTHLQVRKSDNIMEGQED